MLTLAASDTIAAGASAATEITCTLFGMELSGSTETYRVLDQRQLAAAPATIYTATAVTAFIRSITVVNTGSSTRTFQIFRGGTAAANAITPIFTIRAGYTYNYEDGQGWTSYSPGGDLQTSFGPYILLQNYGITGSLAETFDRNFCTETNVALLVSGRLSVQAIWLTAGQVINNIAFHSATTALATGTNQLFGIYDLNRQLLATTVNDTSTAWAANTLKSLALTASYTVGYTGLYYLAIMVAATTVPTIKGNTAPAASQLHGQVPILNGTSTTGLTVSLPNPCAAIAVTTTNAWGAVL
jgi:hypothetical protein